MRFPETGPSVGGGVRATSRILKKTILAHLFMHKDTSDMLDVISLRFALLLSLVRLCWFVREGVPLYMPSKDKWQGVQYV